MWYGTGSVYEKRFDDAMGIFFTSEEFPELTAGMDDVSGVLQKAVGRLIEEQSYGILYIPEGEYRIKETVKIPPSVRLIGYGKKRPVFVLPEDAKGYDNEASIEQLDGSYQFAKGYPDAKYMFWFIGDKDYEAEEPKDADAATFYSAISNIDFRIEGTHPGAICIRAHFAQHGFVSHCHFDLGNGLAGLFDVGNEMEDLTFVGGTYGIVCRMCSPGWPFALLDSVFDGQKKAAVLSGCTGFTGFRLRISNTPQAFGRYLPGVWEKLYLEDCILENISQEAIVSGDTTRVIEQTNLKNIYCKNVSALIRQTLAVTDECYLVEDYVSGYLYSDTAEEQNKQMAKIHAIEELPAQLESDIPPVPPMEQWVSVKQHGVVGDGETDDTQALQKALDAEQVLYFPQGIYRISDTLRMRPDTTLYGLSPITTQLVIVDDTPEFAGFGAPKALLETAQGGFAYVNGIGIDTAGKNPRAAGIRWMADETSYMNDVKFVGGHGLMFRDGRNAYGYLYNASRTADYNPDRIWDYQYASLWITQDGGGIFKDIWSASPYAEAGIAITHTHTKGRMYAISLEHHVRNEMKLYDVKNWSFYALQTEEEKAEGLNCQPIELVNCEHIVFANYFLFRVVAVDRPYENGIRLWNSRDISFLNVHNKAQMQYTFTLTLEDKTTGFYAKSPEYARLTITGNGHRSCEKQEGYEVIADGFSFAQGAAFDCEGNLYWCDKQEKRIYCYKKKEDMVTPVLDVHFLPSALAFDTQGNLLVAADYSELKTTVPGQPYLTFDPKNFHPFFSWFYKRGEKVYAVDPRQPFQTITELKKVPADKLQPVKVYRPAELDYSGMYEQIITKPVTEYYQAPDGVTALEATIDLGRSLLLTAVEEGKEVLVADDADRKVFSYAGTADGNYTGGRQVADKGQYGAIRDENGMVWTVDDKLYGFLDGKQQAAEPVPRDAYTIVSNGTDTYLFGRGKIYREA